ncbi:MAG TPA: hypothetical protein VNM92_07900 [Thermoanaerobaculia bacterium]|nr:hypothetical protein [Thermoanaerobaculia bacterium]
MIWREKQWTLIAIGTLLLLNVIFFLTYRVRYQERIKELDAKLATSEGKLNEARKQRVESDRELGGYRQVEAEIESVYRDRWSTPQLRLTGLLQEMSQLAMASQLIPKSTSYSQSEQKRERGSTATTMDISFSVQGTYQQARRLINLLELSDEFVIIRSIALTSADASTISLSLQLQTLFRGDERSLPTAREQRGL